MNLTKRQQAAVIGMVLGDGYLQATGAKNARLRLEQSIKQKDYLLWKAGLLPALFQGKPVFLDRIHPKTKKVYQYARQQSNASPVLGGLRKLFYPNGRKRIPDNLAKYFRDDIAFAIWFYDDGYYYGRDRCSYLYLGTVSRHEADVARSTIAEKFGITSTVADKKQKGFVLYFSRIESEKIKAILKKYPVPGMAYKIPLTP
jgi:LAGLIDADG DNA endonuclease family